MPYGSGLSYRAENASTDWTHIKLDLLKVSLDSFITFLYKTILSMWKSLPVAPAEICIKLYYQKKMRKLINFLKHKYANWYKTPVWIQYLK